MDDDDIENGKPFLNAIQREMRDNGIENAEKIIFRNFSMTSRNMQVKMRDSDPTKYDEITGTAVIASENPVVREIYIPGEGWRFADEILIMSGLNRERVSILPLLKDHRHFNTDYQIGDWSNVRIDPDNPSQMLADYRISGDDDNQTFCHRFARGYIKTFSCAYTVDSTIQEETDGKISLRIVGWTLYEISAVAVPADFKCVGRSFGMKSFSRGVENMDEDEILEGAPANPETEGTPEGEQRSATLSQESANDIALRARAAEIGAPAGFVRTFIGTSVTPDQMTRKFHEHLNARASRDTQQVSGSGIPARPIQVDSSRTSFVATLGRAFAKSDLSSKGVSVEFTAEERGLGLDLNAPVNAKQILRAIAKQHNVRLPDDVTFDVLYEIRSIAPHVPEDFAKAMSAAIQHVQLGSPDVIPYWGAGITRTQQFTSFAGGIFHLPLVADELLPTDPGSEVKGGTMRTFDTEGKLTTLNRRYPLARQLFEANGVGLFSDLNSLIQNAAITGENRMLQKKVLTNPVMSDGTPFFHASRFNVATNVPRSIDGVGLVQAAAFGDGSGMPFTMVLTAPKNLTVMRQLAGNPNASEVSKINPFGGTFTPVAIPGLPEDMDIWITDPRIRAAFLRLIRSGQEVPLTRIIYTAMFDGMELLAAADRGVAHGDPRGGFVAFTGAQPATLPNGEDANFEAEDIEEVLEGRSQIDWSM